MEWPIISDFSIDLSQTSTFYMAELVDEMTSSKRKIQFIAENSMVKKGWRKFCLNLCCLSLLFTSSFLKLLKQHRHGNLNDSISSINTKHIITIVNKGYSGLRISAHVFVDQAALYQCRMEVPFHLQSGSLLSPISFKTKFLVFIINVVHVPLTCWYATHLHTNGYIRNSQHN